MTNARLNKRQRRTTHPGELLREEILPAAKITQGELAKRMGVSRRTVNEICQERPPGGSRPLPRRTVFP